ncbi:MAG: hypothetical protein O3A57_08630 [Bacteroidetes bacterium]|nr:hypothetical protein [Bacteroidota bacterium]
MNNKKARNQEVTGCADQMGTAKAGHSFRHVPAGAAAPPTVGDRSDMGTEMSH